MKKNGSFTNPIGSVLDDFEQEIADSYERDNVQPEWSGRHAAWLSRDNPYRSNYIGAENNQDASAMYDKATQWEADRANLEEQRAYDYMMLQEQRQYDSPLEELKRKRAAGINPDIPGSAGSGSSGSSAQVGRAVQPSTTGNTPVQSPLTIAQQFQSAASMISAISSAAGTVIGGIDTIANLPSKLKLNRAQASVADQTVDAQVSHAKSAAEIASLGVHGAQLANTAAQLSNQGKITENINTGINTYGQLAEYITPDMKPDERAKVYKMFGISEDQHSTLNDGLTTYFSNPKFGMTYEKNKLEHRKNTVDGQKYTNKVLEQLTDYDISIKLAKGNFEVISTRLRTNLATYLESQNISERTGELMINQQNAASAAADASQMTSSLTVEQVKLQRDMLVHDVETWSKSLVAVKDEYNKIDATIERLTKEYGDNPTPGQQAVLDAMNSYKSHLFTLGSQQLGEMYDIVNQANQLRYNASWQIHPRNGNVTPTYGTSNEVNFGRLTFGTVIAQDHSDTEVTASFVNNLLGSYKDLGKAAVGAK